MSALSELIVKRLDGSWADSAKADLERFARERYGAKWDKKIQIRVNGETNEDAAPFAAFIPAGQPKSGPYGGMSFVIFPSKDAPALICLGIGTNGLSPDEQALSRPGHARKVLAISRWLSHLARKDITWAKPDPVRIDLGMPKYVSGRLNNYKTATDKYEKVLYAMFISDDPAALSLIEKGAHTFCDVFAEERGLEPLTPFQPEKKAATDEWVSKAMPNTTEAEVSALLNLRRFVIIEGPPGTGKTRLAEKLITGPYEGKGASIQFHPGTTYETFIGGLAPSQGANNTGLQFTPRRGHLMDAAAEASKNPDKNYLLHIDEINRADLAKVLGEAIFLFEPTEPDREIKVFHDFGVPFDKKVKLPGNLHILGTMNSADRSIAILDIAVRRRFSFISLWPDVNVLQSMGASQRMKDAFQRLFFIFMEEATNEAFSLMPGHAYFLDGGSNTKSILNAGLKPLLNEYLLQGYVSGFSDSIRAYIEWLDLTE
ncbi:MAG: hypothetical protein A2117_01350 [Candidatus Wildermuthbacteria bacterium GWA2_46_15]|uniref:ATPase dynein-related AAA domain-containing protein n=1 Tax=Candidatus Wildermuthbacteria bacterium GWA2_46_15 TaxID=1802443 RepID=A0A1G2QQH3_9BACT|nr:MAG: hypothetical protein A2117_01350 [Candidatus Wildermuthbacteria bacterium GWA2_46_15]